MPGAVKDYRKAAEEEREVIHAVPGRRRPARSPARRALKIVVLLAVIAAAAVVFRQMKTRESATPPVVLDPAVRAELEAAERATLVEKMDRLYPMHAQGEGVTLRRTSGIVHRGTLVEITDDAVVLTDKGDTHVTIEFTALDKASRFRCDAAHRQDSIAQQAAVAVEKSLR